MTNIHRWASGQADPSFPQAVMHWLVEVASYPSEQLFPTLMVGVQKLFLTNANFLDKFKHLVTSCFTICFLQTLRGREDLAPTMDSLATGVLILHRLISLHYTIQHTLSSRTTWENSNMHINAFSVAKEKKKISSKHNTSYESLGFLQQGSHQHIDIRAALQND